MALLLLPLQYREQVEAFSIWEFISHGAKPLETTTASGALNRAALAGI